MSLNAIIDSYLAEATALPSLNVNLTIDSSTKTFMAEVTHQASSQSCLSLFQGLSLATQSFVTSQVKPAVQADYGPRCRRQFYSFATAVCSKPGNCRLSLPFRTCSHRSVLLAAVKAQTILWSRASAVECGLAGLIGALGDVALH